MASWGDRWNQMAGRTRIVVCRLFIHLAGGEVAPLLGVLNQAARQAVGHSGDLRVLGEGLVDVCQSLLQASLYWQSVANEGDIFWNEGDAGDYVEELFTDTAQRYQEESTVATDPSGEEDPLALPITQNLVVSLTVAYEGEVPQLETDLSEVNDVQAGLKALINLHYQQRLRAIQVHFSPAQLGDELTSDQLLLNFPELVPL